MSEFFEQFFKRATGHAPFPFQTRLATEGERTASGAASRIRRHRSIRLREYDHAAPGAHFVTICARDRACVFGGIIDGAMACNDAGRAAADAWDALPNHYRHASLDAFAVVPNHVHGIIVITGELNRIRQYIADNPARWDTDADNPANAAVGTRRACLNQTRAS